MVQCTMRVLLLCSLALCIVWNVQTSPVLKLDTRDTLKIDTSKLEVPEPKTNPAEENLKDKDVFEGDIVLTPKQKETVKELIEVEQAKEKGQPTRQKRKHYYMAFLWPKGIVPYDTSVFANNKKATDVIAAAIRHIETMTCIKFKKKTSGDRIKFVSGSGCKSPLGKSIEEGKGYHPITLASGCFNAMGTVAHEMIHALGFMHEQSRPDRDTYVYIDKSAISQGMEHNFDKYEEEVTRTRGVAYDLGSIMHYGSMFFSKDGKTRTIVARDPAKESLMGQRDAMSKNDAKVIRKTYKCSGKGSGSTSGITHGKPCIDQNTTPPCAQFKSQCSTNKQLQGFCPKLCGLCTESYY